MVRMVKKGVIAFALLALGLGIAGWINRDVLITQIALYRAKEQRVFVEPYKPINWDQGPSSAAMPATKRAPNVVFILFDDLGYNDISTFGGGLAKGSLATPNIDRLAQGGAVFTQAYSGTSTCAPSRAMLMTGRYPTRTGFEFTPAPDGMSFVRSTLGNFASNGVLPDIRQVQDTDGRATSFENKGLPGEEITVAEMLNAHDYHTVHIGKWHLGRRADFLPNAQGFDESLLMHSGLYLPEEHPDVVNAKLDAYIADQFHWAGMTHAASFNAGAPFSPGGYLTDWWTDESLKVIEANKNRPFFLYLAHWAPHSPLQATRADYEAVGDIGPHHLRVYAAMVLALDRSVGRILDKLESEGLADNTIVVLSSDNGGAGYVGLPEINAPFRGWKSTFFEGGIRVPMLVKWPREIPAGTVVDTPVAHIDLLPTLAAATGARLPSDRLIDGHNILVEATGNGEIERLNDALFWQSGTYKVVRAGDWKLHVDERQGRSWLFNLASDPTEKQNLALANPDKVARLKAILDAHQTDSVGPLYPHKLETPILIDRTTQHPPTPDDEYVIWPN